MNYIKKMARGCCSCQNSTSIQSTLIGLVSDKLGELTGDPDNPLNLTEAAKIISDLLDKLSNPSEEATDDDEYASDDDIVDLFNG